MVEKQFSLEGRPSAPTKEKRFAYSLYLDMLVLMLDIASQISKRGGDKPLEQTRFLKRVKNDELIKSLVNKYRYEPFAIGALAEELAEEVKDSAIYKNFTKKRDASMLGGDETVWKDIFNTIIYPNPRLNELFATRENFTEKGVERMRDMMNETFVNFMASHDSGADVLNALRVSLDKARELYFRLLWLPVELTDLQERNLDEKRHKYLKTQEDMNPDLRFVDNLLVRRLRECEELSEYIGRNKISWLGEDRVMMDNLLKSILDSELYADYMSARGDNDMHADAEFWRQILRRVVFDNEYFLESLEDKSVFWNDDLESMGTFVLKSLRRMEEGTGADAILDKFKDEEDARFGSDLVKAVLKNKDTYRGYLDEAIDKNLWESERLAFMDVVIIETALAEMLNFPKIPLTVTLNEYIEIAKSYSTAKSGGFVNGILGTIIPRLRQDGILLKN